MISRTSAERVLNAALTTGGDFAELYMEDGESHSISMLDGVVENAAYSRARGAGVRILSGTRSAYAYTVDISESALVETAKRASAIIKGEGGWRAALHGYTRRQLQVQDTILGGG